MVLSTVTLDMTKSETHTPMLTVTQGDHDMPLSAVLTSGNNDAGLDGQTAIFRATKPDGNIVEDDAGAVSGGTLTYTPPAELYTAAGVVTGAYFAFSGGDSSPKFKIYVYPRFGDMDSNIYVADAEELVENLRTVLDAASHLETDAKANVTAEANKQIEAMQASAKSVADDATKQIAANAAQVKSVADDATVSKAANAKTVAAAASAINADRDKQLAAQAASAKSVADDAAAKKAAQAQSLTSVQADATKQKAAQAASAKTVADEAAKAKTAMDDAVTGATDKSIATITDANLLAWVTQEAGE